MKTLLKNGNVYLNGEFVKTDLAFDKTVLSVGEISDSADAVDITPGFIDIHIHGREGFDVTENCKEATEELTKLDIDVFIHNAGAYSIPRYKSDSGYDNVFTINFISPYYIIRNILPQIEAKKGRVAVTGSIAHRYSKTDENDVDFSSRKAASHVYGNAKRYLMFSLYELFKDKQELLSVVHPGISFTGITDHYPKVIFALIKIPMKVIFMKPGKACLSTVKGVFEYTPYHTWIGPRFFDIWGNPESGKLKITKEESEKIGKTAEEIYYEQTEKYKTVSI